MTRQQCFEILELPPTAAEAEIKKAFRQLVQVWHPDRFSNSELKARAEAKLVQINTAYSTLVESVESSANIEYADEDEESVLFRDASVEYLGGDPRFGDTVKPCVLELSKSGVAVVTFSGQVPDGAMWYPTNLFAYAETTATRYKPTANRREYAPTPPIAPGVVHMRVHDPEGIVDGTIPVKLRFRNAYFAELFLKRLATIVPLTTSKKSNSLTKSDEHVIVVLSVIAAVGILIYAVTH